MRFTEDLSIESVKVIHKLFVLIAELKFHMVIKIVTAWSAVSRLENSNATPCP